MDALAVLTVSPVPPEAQGLLPLQDVRFPALFKPTQEPILVDGSLVQLGDLTVRQVDDELAEIVAVAPTKRFWKFMFYFFGAS